MALPKDILDRSERVYAYHRSTKLLFTSKKPVLPEDGTPVWVPQFPDLPVILLRKDLMEASTGTLSLMESSVGALPESLARPPQTLRTLASWLYYADGQLADGQLADRQLNVGEDGRATTNHTWPSNGSTYPTNLYVAAFAIADLEPGLYHFSAGEFALRKLRDGPETLNHLKRGRPDLAFLKNAPAALLVSTVFFRAAWRYGARAYRTALLDAGHLTQNLVTTASALGIQTMTRLRMTDSTMRELIGLRDRPPFTEAEPVQSMVVWAEQARREVEEPTESEADDETSDNGAKEGSPAIFAPSPGKPRKALNHGALSFSSVLTPELVLPSIRRSVLGTIPRATQPVHVPLYGSVTAVHQDCVAPGVAVREIRPPVTEISPLPPDFAVRPMPPLQNGSAGISFQKVILEHRIPPAFTRKRLSFDLFRRLVRSSLSAGTFFPMFPDGPHMALLRPLWIVHAVEGFESGLWYYDGKIDGWSMLRAGSWRFEAGFFALDDERFSDSAAVCMLVAGFPTILGLGGPDTYRLALLEAGTAAHRLHLAAAALGVVAVGTASFYDDELRKFFGLELTGWEPLQLVAIGEGAKNSGDPP